MNAPLITSAVTFSSRSMAPVTNAVVLLAVFTALHGMQTRSSDENSVRPSVRPSVCHTREL